MSRLPLPGASSELVFPPFRLDLLNERVLDGERAIPLRPKTYAVLRYLIDRPGQLVTKDEILDAVWPAVAVSDSVLKVCIREIREALGDDPSAPQFVETAHRRGYRFVGRLTGPAGLSAERPPRPVATPPLVGRTQELARMQARLARAIEGRRTITFIAGEPGIGKTALAEALIATAAGPRFLVSRGQCVEHYGASEAYLPILEALTHLCRASGREHVVNALARYAPTWLAQMPAVVADNADARGSLPAGSPVRMLREMADALEAIAAEMLLLLVLEDLHWSDASTIDLIAYLARRREPARLMIVGTYRPAETIGAGHPLRAVVQELLAHGACEEEPLGLLDDGAIGEYLTLRFPEHQVPREVPRVLHRHTTGNPLFLVSLVDYLCERGVLIDTNAATPALRVPAAELSVPTTLIGVIDRQVDLLADDDRGLLEVASVAGPQFTAAEVASAVERSEAAVEASFDRLARYEHFLHRGALVELTDGAVTARFGFVHALHQHALYQRVPLAWRTELHRRIGDWLERRFDKRAGELAAALAMHFERGRDYRRAVQYCRVASETAQQRFANDEAIRLATRGLDLLDKAWPDGPERDREELALRLARGVPLLAARGYGASEVEQSYQRALHLSRRLGASSPPTFPILAGLYAFYLIRADLAIAQSLSAQLLEQARVAGDPELTVYAHWSGLVTNLNQGRFAAARDHFEEALPLFELVDARSYLMRFGQDAEAVCRAFGAWAFWSLGDVQRAYRELEAARERAAALSHAHSLCFSRFFMAFISQMQRDPAATLEHATATAQVAVEHGFPQWIAFATILRGWASWMMGETKHGVAQMEEGIAAYRRIGAAISMPHFVALHAEAVASAGHHDDALARVLDAIAEARQTGGLYYESELLGLEADIRLMRRAPGDASAARLRLHEAIAVARRQQAISFEHRAQRHLRAIKTGSPTSSGPTT